MQSSSAEICLMIHQKYKYKLLILNILMSQLPTKCISMVIAKTASRNVAFKSDKLMDALFQEGQSAPQSPQTLFGADYVSTSRLSYIYYHYNYYIRYQIHMTYQILDILSQFIIKDIAQKLRLRYIQYIYCSTVDMHRNRSRQKQTMQIGRYYVLQNNR